MINRRLVGIVPGSRKYIALQVLCQWLSLLCNILMMTAVTALLARVLAGKEASDAAASVLIIAACIFLRHLLAIGASRAGYLSAKEVKSTLRRMIYRKLLRLGTSYREKVNSSEVVQVAVEGVEQLDTYFGAYLPQFFYAVLAPLTLFACLCFYCVPAAAVLLICVPLIPVSIALVQTWAKKLLADYWGQYTRLGNTFLENLQGLTTLKIYQSDGFKNREMNEEAEKFRSVTMKVLSMQLNSVTIMDFIAYGGAALGVILAATQYAGGRTSLQGCLLIILLSADFFIPMRQLGSYFHVAMNGAAAGDKIFRLLDLPEESGGTEAFPDQGDIRFGDLRFSYAEDREILHGLNFEIKRGRFTAVVGESGSGKSTVASVLTGRNKGYTGHLTVDGVEWRDLQEESLVRHITYIGHDSYLFKGTVRENLMMADAGADDEKLWSVLERVRLADFLRREKGLDTVLTEGGTNLSGGQRQRLALGRALLRNSEMYIFDEATSNIDVESENDILKEILKLAETKTVLLITHRLANVVQADQILVMESGSMTEQGTHSELLAAGGTYSRLWNVQQELENFGRSGEEA